MRGSTALPSRPVARIAYRTLKTVYASSLTGEAKLAIKNKVTEVVREKWNFSRPITNATLAQSRAYHGGIPIFAELLAHCGHDWSRFRSAVRPSTSPPSKRPAEGHRPRAEAVDGATLPQD